MVEPVGGKSPEVGASLPRQAQVVKTSSASKEQPATGTLELGVTALSPRMRADPVAGVLITEYLANDGQVERQYPSEAAVAYLRSGLMEDGRPAHDKVESDPTLIV